MVFATNEKYAPYAGVAIQSILEHAGPGHHYRVYVLHSGLSDDMVRLLEAQQAQQLSVRCLNVNKLIQLKNTSLREKSYFSKEMYYRFLIPEVFSFYHQVVYLDCDVIVERDIADILPADMGEMLLAAVRNSTTKPWISRLDEFFHLTPDDYFNSGVLVLNVSQWKLEKTPEKCFAALKEIPPQLLWYPDQDILNIVCQGRVLYLDEAWNYYWHMIYGKKEFVALCKPIVDKIGEEADDDAGDESPQRGGEGAADVVDVQRRAGDAGEVHAVDVDEQPCEAQQPRAFIVRGAQGAEIDGPFRHVYRLPKDK